MTAEPSARQFAPPVPVTPGGALAPIQREFNRLFDQLAGGWNAFTQVELMPRMDVTETKDAVELTLELPGMAQDDVKIDVEDDLLTVSGEKKAESERKDENYRISERSYGAFSRSVTLPRSVVADKITATMIDGVLKIVAPKNGAAVAKTIEIQVPKQA